MREISFRGILILKLVAADVSPLHLIQSDVRADSRRLLRFKGSIRECYRRIPTPALSSEERENRFPSP